jgi:cAMP-dependent protein kinase regulator
MGNQCTKETASAIEQESMPSAKARNFRESVLDITGKPVNMSQTAADGGPTGVPRLKNIFAAPVKIDADYVFPVYEKSEEDLKFVESVAKENFIFSGVDATELVNLLNAFESYTAVKGDKIITEGETGDYFYILQKGKVRFTVDGATVGEASDGASFGDLALLYNCPRAASCTADSSCQLWRVEQGAFRQILANSTLNKDKAVLDTLKKVSFLQDLDIEYLHKMANAVETKTFSKGSQLIKKGDQGLEFFVLKSGKVTVSDIEVGGKKFDDQILESGAYFGERAIVKEEPRAANVYATTAVTTLVLSRKQFLEILGPLEDLMTKTNTLRSLVCVEGTNVHHSWIDDLVSNNVLCFYLQSSY